MKQKLTIPVALIATFSIVLLPIQARGYSFWSDLNELFSDTYGQAHTYLQTLVSETFGNQAPFVWEAINTATGSLGLSDPLVVKERIKEGVISNDDVFDLSKPPALVQATVIGREVDRQRLRSHVASVIGQEGQGAIQLKMEQVAVTLEETQELGFLAEDAFSTQDAIKKMAQQNVKNTELLGALQTEVINSRIDSQFEAEVLANLSQTLDEEQTTRFNRDLALIVMRLQQGAEASLF